MLFCTTMLGAVAAADTAAAGPAYTNTGLMTSTAAAVTMGALACNATQHMILKFGKVRWFCNTLEKQAGIKLAALIELQSKSTKERHHEYMQLHVASELISCLLSNLINLTGHNSDLGLHQLLFLEFLQKMLHQYTAQDSWQNAPKHTDAATNTTEHAAQRSTVGCKAAPVEQLRLAVAAVPLAAVVQLVLVPDLLGKPTSLSP